jgi:plasmid stabilization system protein ParE
MFQVRWEDTALGELAAIWVAADSALRRLITAATNRIDQQLQTDPLGDSESRPGGRRILFVSPLGITFRIEADGQTVSVLRVWLFRRRSQAN